MDCFCGGPAASVSRVEMYEASAPPLQLKVAPQKEKAETPPQDVRAQVHMATITTRLGPDWLADAAEMARTGAQPSLPQQPETCCFGAGLKTFRSRRSSEPPLPF